MNAVSDESGAQTVIAKVGLWWPAADEGGLRSAASAWCSFASEVDEAGAESSAAARSLVGSNDGPAVDAFADFWARYDGTAGSYLPATADGARAMAEALSQFADAVADAKSRVEELAVEIGATLVVGTALALVTFGAAEAAAAGISAGLIASAASIGVELSATAGAIAGGILSGGAFGAVEAAAVDVAVAQPIRIEAFHDGGFRLGEVEQSMVAGGALGGLVGASSTARVIRVVPRWKPTDGTPVLGKIPDTEIAEDWPDHAVLNIRFWSPEKNDAWIQSIIDQRGRLYLASPLTRANLTDPKYLDSVFGREYKMLRRAGYRRVGDYMEPPA